MHQTLSEGGIADDQSPIVILNRAGDNFRCRSALPVYQHDQRDFETLIPSRRIIRALRGRPAAVRNDELVLIQKHIRHANCLIQQATAITSQVDDQPIQLGRIEMFQRVGKIAIGGFVEGGDAHISNSGFYHLEELHAGARDFVAHDSDVNRFVPALASQGDVDRGSFGTLEHLGHFGCGQSSAGFPIDFEDHVTRTDAGLVSGRIDERRLNDGVVVPLRYNHADAVVSALLLFAK